MTDITRTEVARLRERRLALGLTQQRLAQLADCSLSSVELLDRGLTPRHRSDVASRIDAALAAAESGRRKSDHSGSAPTDAP